MTAPTVADPGDHVYAQILTYRGVISTGNPWDITGGGVKATASATLTVTGVTTTVPDTRIVQAVARDNDSAATAFSAQTNAALTGITERSDAGTALGNGGGFAVWDGVKAAAGATGNTTATVTSSINAFLTIALKPPPSATLSSAANQTSTLGDPPTLASTLTVTDASTPTITAAQDIRIRIPATFNMTWDTAVTTVTLGGGAAGKVSATLSAYEDSNRTAVLNVTTNFAASDQLTIAGLKFRNFTATSAANNLQLVVAGAGGATAATDDKTITIVDSNVKSAGSRILNDNAGRTPVAAEDVDVTNWDKSSKFLVTIGMQTSAGFRCELNQGTNKLQWRNVTDAPGTWNNLGTAAGLEMILFNSANLVDDNALTLAEAQIVGTGIYIDGKEAENNLDKVWNRFRDGEYSAIQFAIDPSGGIAGKTYQFRFIVNPGMCDAGSNVMSVSITLSAAAPAPGSFNAFESSTAAGAITGRIFTKLVGTAFSLDVVAISSGVQQNAFTNTVTVELLANTTGAALDAQNCPTTFTLVQTVSPNPTITGGRSTVSFAAVATAYRDVRVRVRFPVGSPTVTSCSTNNFSIRPTAFSSVTSNMTNSGTSGPPVARAGDAFTITGVAGAGYNGTPSIDSTKIAAHAGAVQIGSVAGSFGAANPATGTATDSTFTYSEVGNFTIGVNGVFDSTFTAADTPGTDCTNDFSNTLVGGLYGCSFGNSAASAAIGRFRPDHFIVTPGTLTNRQQLSCASTFTYEGEPLRVTFMLTARNGFGTPATTQNYTTTSGYAHLDGAVYANFGFGAVDLADAIPPLAATALTARVSSGTSSGTWAAGVGSFTVDLAVSRAAAPDGPFESLWLGVLPADADGVTLRTVDLNLDTDVPINGNDRVLLDSSKVRYGRLRLGTASGSQLQPLRVPVEAQYWNGSAFITNTLDACTTLATTDIGLGNAIGGISTSVAAVSAFQSGRGAITLAKPTAGTHGSIDLAVNLGTGAAANACPDSPAFAPATTTAADKAYLRGNWCNPPGTYTKDPSTRARFGIRRGSDETIYTRENY